MNYYLDTEFHEYQRKPWFSKPFRTVELISIGIVAEDGREYYAISKDFDLKDAWNSWQPKDHNLPMGIVKEYWLRHNVLKPIFEEINVIHEKKAKGIRKVLFFKFSYWSLLLLLRWYGKSNSQIAKEVKRFIEAPTICKVKYEHEESITGKPVIAVSDFNIEFYAYYGDYDWVVFCWLFGRMIDLPKGFPMYCRDLKQMLDEKIDKLDGIRNKQKAICFRFETKLQALKDLPTYPQQSNEHNALADAKWNKELYNFIDNL